MGPIIFSTLMKLQEFATACASAEATLPNVSTMARKIASEHTRKWMMDTHVHAHAYTHLHIHTHVKNVKSAPTPPLPGCSSLGVNEKTRIHTFLPLCTPIGA